MANHLTILAERFAALDFAAENAEIDAIRSEAARLSAAIEKAEARCTEIARLKSERRDSGREVARALLDGGTAIEAAALAPSGEALESERLALRAGINTLRGQQLDLEGRRDEIEAECRRQIAAVAQPLADKLAGDLQAAGDQLLAAWAALRAVSTIAGAGGIDAAVADRAVQGLRGRGGAFQWPDLVPVPDDIRACLSALAGKGDAAPFRDCPKVYPVPALSPLAAMTLQ